MSISLFDGRWQCQQFKDIIFNIRFWRRELVSVGASLELFVVTTNAETAILMLSTTYGITSIIFIAARCF